MEDRGKILKDVVIINYKSDKNTGICNFKGTNGGILKGLSAIIDGFATAQNIDREDLLNYLLVVGSSGEVTSYQELRVGD